MAALTEEDLKRLGQIKSVPDQPNNRNVTLASPNASKPAPSNIPSFTPNTPSPAQPKPQPLAAPTPQQVQENLPGLTVGQQTRGAGGVRLDQQQAPAGKELIGMRSGVPIYADATDVYSSQVPKVTADIKARDQSVSSAAAVTAGLGKTAVNTPAAQYANAVAAAPVTPKDLPIDALREQYQKDATAARQEIEQKYKQPEQPKYFSKEYADQFTAAQAAANQRAKERIAYGGQPVRDTSNSMAFVNSQVAAMRAEAARPKLAGKEYIETSGLDKATQKRLLWGVGENGENLDVTEDVVDNEMARRGITKRPGPTFQNPFLGTNRPSNRIFGKPGTN